jgi:sulfur carrier protein ThiS
MQILFIGRDHKEIVSFENKITIREALNLANIAPSTVIVSFEQNILPHSTIIKSDAELNVITVSSGG